jgi:hypothetical protein
MMKSKVKHGETRQNKQYNELEKKKLKPEFWKIVMRVRKDSDGGNDATVVDSIGTGVLLCCTQIETKPLSFRTRKFRSTPIDHPSRPRLCGRSTIPNPNSTLLCTPLSAFKLTP